MRVVCVQGLYNKGMGTVCDTYYTKAPNKCCIRKINVYVPRVDDVKVV